MTPDSHEPTACAEEVFADFLAAVESGDPADLEQLCDRHPDLAAELLRLHAEFQEAGDICAELKAASYLATVPGGSGLVPAGAPLDESTWQRLITLLEQRHPEQSRYRLLGRIAEGGMGIILKVWDNEMDRPLAMKVAMDATRDEAGHSTPLTHSLGRFLEEAQVTGQLDHPGIVPVHELGLDADRRVFFTMRLVQGKTLREVIHLVHEGQDGWTLPRALGVVLKVCEAVAYAHSKAVLHRDLKPSNVMVGQFGEVYTMDWGLAKAVGTEAESGSDPDSVTDSETSRGSSPTLTLPGSVLGTPAYMAPEQALGRLRELDQRTDVHALGAILYHVLTGRAPHDDGSARSPEEVVRLVQAGPPAPVHHARTDLPAELEAICDKAMARDPEQRYQDVMGLAEDLRAYLEQRVVRAYETGPLAELRKWVLRNRLTAASIAAGVGIAVTLLGLLFLNEARNTRDLLAVNQKLDVARASAVDHLEDYQRLEDISELERLEGLAKELWPAWPENIAAMKTWLAEAGVLAARLPLHREFLDQVRASGREDLGPGGAVAARTWLPGLLEDFVAELTAFTGADPATGAMASVRQRLKDAASITRRSIDDHADAWEESISEIFLSDLYDGLEIEPQLGLIPLGPDPESGLWEFAVLDTGELPERDTGSGELLWNGGSALVLVLIPGAEFVMGVQSDDRTAPRYQPRPFDQGPLHQVALAPYFLSKFEMTQSQWHAITGTRPSFFPLAARGSDQDWRPLPVEQVSRTAAVEVLRRVGLVLPTEAQWEAAARAGSDTRWWCGEEAASIDEARAGNVYDRDCRRTRPDDDWGESEDWRDGYADTAPCGQLTANPYGLHDVIGNVMEWCLDRYGPYDLAVRDGDGLRLVDETETVFVYRGGSFDLLSTAAAAAYRDRNTATTANFNLGVRPARTLHGD